MVGEYSSERRTTIPVDVIENFGNCFMVKEEKSKYHIWTQFEKYWWASNCDLAKEKKKFSE